MTIVRSLLIGMILVLISVSATATEQKVFVYGWLPSLKGELTFKVPGEPNEEASASVIDSLDAVFMGSYELRKDKWSFLADMIYLKVSGDTQGLIPSVNLDLELTTKLYGFYGGYNLLDDNNMDVNFVAGVRYFGLDLDVTRSGGRIVNGTFSSSVDNHDAVIGIHGEYAINQQWYVPYHFDVGAGDSDLTWQASASIGYKFGWGDVMATYRYIHYDKGDSLLIEDFNLYGPKLGFVFHF